MNPRIAPPLRMATNPNSSKPLNPYAQPYPSKAPVLLPPPMLPQVLYNQVIAPVPAPDQPTGIPLGFPCPPGQHLLWQTSVTLSPPFQRRDDLYRVCSRQPFWPNNGGGGSGYYEPYVTKKEGVERSGTSLVCREKKLGASARKFFPKRKDVNRQRVTWSAKKPDAHSVPLHTSSTVNETGEEMFGGKTTSVMIKNIPNQFESDTLLNIIDKHCRDENTKGRSDAAEKSNFIRSEYDFLYLPMDFRREANKGYAFVNFTTVVAASRFAKAFEKHKWRVSVNRKICEVTIAKLQGKAALQNHFKNSAFKCRKDSYLPLVFSPPRDGFVRSQSTHVGRRV